MQLIVRDHYCDAQHHIEGNESDIRSQLLTLYPFLLIKFGPYADLKMLVRALDRTQIADAVLVDSLVKSDPAGGGVGLHIIRHGYDTPHGQVHTVDDALQTCRAAAEFLSAHPCTDDQLRQALLESDGNPELAALIAHGLPASSLDDLRAVAASALQKSESVDGDKPVQFEDVSPTTESSVEFAEIVRRASTSSEILPMKVGGKHAKGMLRARDPETHSSYILKPGSGKQNATSGEAESTSTQSQREAAFYSVACAFGLGDYLPECHMLVIDGMEYAVMKMLPPSFKNMNDLKSEDPNLPARLLHLYNDGTLHKWAALDFVTGNPDRHSGNVMASGDTAKLIDHGSAFAGISFAPSIDGRSFVPYYLRPVADKFASLTVTEKLRKLPRLNAQNNDELRRWLLALNSDILGALLMQYGIDPFPSQARLGKLQKATTYQTADLAVLSAWVVG